MVKFSQSPWLYTHSGLDLLCGVSISFHVVRTLRSLDTGCYDKTNAISEMRKKVNGQFNKINPNPRKRSEAVLPWRHREKSGNLTEK